MKEDKRVLMVFVDGLGIGPPDPAVNPLYGIEGSCLRRLIETEAVPVDASLDIPGLPQSATGQTALLTGVNAAQRMGRHIEGFPGPTLVRIIRESNVFSRVLERGGGATFANAYFVNDASEVESWPMRSVTTVAAMSGLGRVRDRAAMERNEAVYHDVTRAALRDRGYTGPLVTPGEAAGHLAAIAAAHNLTLFEFFQTDRAGHLGRMEEARNVLRVLDGLVSALASRAKRGEFLLLLTSDHGNIEDILVRGHTLNPVPFIALGRGAEGVRARVRSLVDVTPAILECLERGERPGVP
jgi:hypothetical protein